MQLSACHAQRLLNTALYEQPAPKAAAVDLLNYAMWTAPQPGRAVFQQCRVIALDWITACFWSESRLKNLCTCHAIQIIKLRRRTQQSVPGSTSSFLLSDVPYLGVLLCRHQSNIAQRIEQAESSGASLSSHAHLCQNGMQAPCQAHTPTGSAVLNYICSTQSVVMTCHAPQVVKTAITVKEESQYSASTW